MLIIVAVSAVMFFLRDRGITLNSAGLKLLWSQVKQALHTWWLLVRRQTDQMQEAVRGRLNQANVDVRRDPKAGGWRFVRLNALSPRDKLRYFFLSTERRAAEKGVSRQPAETPREYAEAIKETWSPTAVSDDVDPVTEAFLRAQYSPHDIDPADVEDAKAHWQALRRQLRQAPSEAPSVRDTEADS